MSFEVVLKSCSSVKFVNRDIDMQICLNKRVGKGAKLAKPHVSWKQYSNSWQVRINSSIWILKNILSNLKLSIKLQKWAVFAKVQALKTRIHIVSDFRILANVQRKKKVIFKSKGFE